RPGSGSFLVVRLLSRAGTDTPLELAPVVRAALAQISAELAVAGPAGQLVGGEHLTVAAGTRRARIGAGVLPDRDRLRRRLRDRLTVPLLVRRLRAAREEVDVLRGDIAASRLLDEVAHLAPLRLRPRLRDRPDLVAVELRERVLVGGVARAGEDRLPVVVGELPDDVVGLPLERDPRPVRGRRMRREQGGAG